METLAQKLERVLQERVEVEPFNPKWTQLFRAEKEHLLSCLPDSLIRRIEHFGSTAVEGLAAKPIIDMLVEVASLDLTRKEIVPILESQGYDYFWRPTFGDSTPPFYTWFIKRDTQGRRTHHIHMVENTKEFAEHWDRLLFRDYLRRHKESAMEYESLKYCLAQKLHDSRVEYTEAKTHFIQRITQLARENPKSK